MSCVASGELILAPRHIMQSKFPRRPVKITGETVAVQCVTTFGLVYTD
jgi:hypothetical protein